MWDSVLSSLTRAVAQPWAVAAMGLAVTGLCFLLGRAFFRPRPGASRAAEANEAVPRAVTDRRGALRRRGNCITVDLVSPDDPSAVIDAWVVDRSMGGLRLELERQLTVGATMNVRPHKAAESAPWTAVVVRSCTPHQGVWKAGLQFVKTPTYNVLMLFG
jgi:hypothetical protein